jgi:hypothetical protein
LDQPLEQREQDMVSKTLIAVGTLALGVHLWQSHQQAVFARQLEAMADVNGFVPVQAPIGERADTVVILAPLNCPSAGAQRARALAKYLGKHGVPYVQSANYEVAPVADATLTKATAAIATGEIPVVLINGRGQDNPAPWRVIDEYRANQR